MPRPGGARRNKLLNTLKKKKKKKKKLGVEDKKRHTKTKLSAGGWK